MSALARISNGLAKGADDECEIGSNRPSDHHDRGTVQWRSGVRSNDSSSVIDENDWYSGCSEAGAYSVADSDELTWRNPSRRQADADRNGAKLYRLRRPTRSARRPRAHGDAARGLGQGK